MVVSRIIYRLVQIVCLLFIQVFVLNAIPPIRSFIVPVVYFVFILWLPIDTPSLLLLCIAFVYGLVYNALTHTAGLYSAVCVFIAYMRILLLPSFVNLKASGQLANREISPYQIGWVYYIMFLSILSFSYHFFISLLEWFKYSNFLFFLVNTICSSLLSIIMIVVVEVIFYRKR